MTKRRLKRKKKRSARSEGNVWVEVGELQETEEQKYKNTS